MANGQTKLQTHKYTHTLHKETKTAIVSIISPV